MTPYTLADLSAAWAAGRYVSVLLPDGSVATPADPGWEACTAATIAGGPWRRVVRAG